jgi:hypothetical protein
MDGDLAVGQDADMRASADASTESAPAARGSAELVRLRSADGAGVAAVLAVVLLAEAPLIAGFAIAGRNFTGSATSAKYVADSAQHELWADQMARHGRFLTNLLTPERTHAGWFFNPLEFLFGLAERLTGLPYSMLNLGAELLVAPLLAVALVVLARRAGLRRPALPLLVALLAGTFQPLVLIGRDHGLRGWSHLSGVGVDNSPPSAGTWLILPLAVLTLIFLARPFRDAPTSGFRRAGIALGVEAAVYPFLAPALWLAGAFYALLLTRRIAWRRVLPGMAWFTVLPAGPLLAYAVILPRIDPEFERFSRLNYVPIFGLGGLLTSLGLGLATLLGLRRLLVGNEAQRVLGCTAVAVVVALYLPRHPDRSHILYLGPVLVIGAFAAWWPELRARAVGRWHVLAAVAVAAALVSAPYYYRHRVEALVHRDPPAFLTAGDRAAFSWLARQHDGGVVLARTDIGPWVAARGRHRVIAGHYLWTHDWSDRSKEVDAVFDGADPRPLIRHFGVTWIVVDTDRGAPGWVRGLTPVRSFGSTVVLAPRQLTRIDLQRPPVPPQPPQGEPDLGL